MKYIGLKPIFHKSALKMQTIWGAYKLSFFTLGGVDNPFENSNDIIKSVAATEALFTHLYVVLVVGRLLSK